jgi:hypothetical protein
LKSETGSKNLRDIGMPHILAVSGVPAKQKTEKVGFRQKGPLGGFLAFPFRGFRLI